VNEFQYPFRSALSQKIFNNKYRHEGCETWDKLSKVVVEDVCQDWLSKEEKDQLVQFITDMKFIPGGRYLYYAGRPVKFFNNCYLLRAEEDSREDWADLSWKAESCLLTGGGIGVDYSRYRAGGSLIKRTGGLASGPIPKMLMVNEIGRRVMQGGSRRSAIYASLLHTHGDIGTFLETKNWHKTTVPGTDRTLADVKQLDFNWPAPLDMTNISVNYDTWSISPLATWARYSLGMWSKHSELVSLDSASTSSIKKMKPSETLAQRLPLLTTLMFVISGVSTLAVFEMFLSLPPWWTWLLASSFVVLSVPIYLTLKFERYVRRIDDLVSVLWGSTNG
jgi:hypothetical protein